MVDLWICLYLDILKCYWEFLKIFSILPDILNAIAIFLIISEKKLKRLKDMHSVCVFLFIAYSSISFMLAIRNVEISYSRYRYIWMPFMCFYICKYYMTPFFYRKIVKLLFVSQIINIILVFYQSMIMNVRADWANGIFGFKEYNNAAQGMFCLVVSFLGIGLLINKEVSRVVSISMIIISCIVCAVDEIKAYYVMLIVGIVALLVGAKMSRKTRHWAFLIVLGIILLLIIVYRIYVICVPQNNLMAFRGLDNYIRYEAYGTQQGKGYGRLTQLAYVWENAFHENIGLAIIGMGSGTYMYNNIYEFGKIFFNFGFIGLILNVMFVVSLYVKLTRKGSGDTKEIVSIAMCPVILLCCFAWGLYNRSGFMAFWALALGDRKFKG